MKRDKVKDEHANKKGFKMKPLSKKKRIIFSAVWGVIAILAISTAFFFKQNQQQENRHGDQQYFSVGFHL